MLFRKILVQKKNLQARISDDISLPLTETDKKVELLKSFGVSCELISYNEVPEMLPISMAYFLLFVISVFLFPLNPILTFVTCVLLAVGLYQELNGKFMLSYFITLGSKKGVLAKVKGQQSSKKLVFVVPKYFVSLNKAYVNSRGFKFMKKVYLLIAFSALIFTFAVISSVLRKNPVMGYWYIITLITIPFIVYFLLVLRKCFWGPQPVALKNNFTEKLITDLIVKLNNEGGLANTDIYVLFTADRSGDYSSTIYLLDNYRKELEGAYFVNLDFFNGGSLSVKYEEGLIKKHKTSRRLSLAIVGLGNSLSLPKIKVSKKLPIFTPLTMVLSKGYEGINLISKGKVIGEEYEYQSFFSELVKTLDLHL